ncbi:recombinase family protein [Arthrobacter sp. ISL-28]|uniref:recombinase family protein n=1 Tax=Arthrobacter sp. ISL-28 TaxID=2819108 RepID=UPI001BE7BFC0|nr:recombinase family protein [Arthrobacter sp. ISL-28]MBT2522768.1 recombinase family protein [Arthrobacter sp. ISL-28]
MEQTTAAIYARLSSDKRKGTSEEGKTVEEQVRACTAYILSKRWLVGEIYKDNDKSATDGGIRPDFERMLKDAPPVVVAYRASRLSRDVMDTLRLKAAGITGHMEDGGKLDFSSGDSTMLTLIRSVIDAAEGEKKAEFQKLKNLANAKDGKWHYSRPVFGNDRITGKLVAGEAEAIRTAAAGLAKGEKTFFQVAKDWNATGFQTPKSKGAGGKDWTPGTVRNFFTAPRLTGKRVYQGTTYTMDGWEPLLDEETFNDIQSLIESQKTGKRGVQGTRHNPHLLTGIATCGTCGGGLNVSYRGGPGSPRAYRCPTPGHVSRAAVPLEKFVVEKFLYLFMHQGAEKVIHPDGAETAAKLRLERISTIRDHDAWMDEAAEAGLSPVMIAKKEAAHARKVGDIDARLVEIIRETSFAGLLPEMASQGAEALWGRWNDISVEKQRTIVQSLYKGIVVKRGPQGARFRPEFVTLFPSDLMLQLADLNTDAVEINEAELSPALRDALGLT